MDKNQKITFIQNLTASIASELIDKVNSGVIPEHWDGHELRQLLADKFEREVSSLFREKRSARVRRYRNDVATTSI